MCLTNVKPGDTLVLKDVYTTQVVVVERVTRTQIIINNLRFNKSTGMSIGRLQSRSYLTIPKKDEIDKIEYSVRHRNMSYKVSGACQVGALKNVPLEKLEQILDLLE